MNQSTVSTIYHLRLYFILHWKFFQNKINEKSPYLHNTHTAIEQGKYELSIELTITE